MVLEKPFLTFIQSSDPNVNAVVIVECQIGLDECQLAGGTRGTC